MGRAESDHAHEGGEKPISSAFYDAVARRARELWELRGRLDGHAQEDWLQAEAEVRLAEALSAEARQHRAYMKVRVGDSVYIAEYESGAGYTPGELKRGQRVAIRIEHGVIYLKLSGGRELAARIVETQNLQ
jgi:DUF2934 family protein